MTVRAWRPDYPLDMVGVLAPLRRGAGDPSSQVSPDGVIWLAANTPTGPGTLSLRRSADGEVSAEAWGDGADFLLDGLPALLGADDDDSDFVAHHDVVAQVRHRMPGMRLGASGRVWDVLMPAILEQKVTGIEARRSWRELCRRFGTWAPGPMRLRVPPSPRAIMSIADWDWHRAGVDNARRRALIASAQVAGRLERAVSLKGAEGRALLRKVPGIGVWTAAEVAQRAWGDPDAVSFGDFHIPAVVGYALLGRKLDDEGMFEVLAPYSPQRQRAVRYIEAAGFSRPRFGPRLAPRDYRAM
ncbi:DNA-3-methyladenine glycosylase family protein [Actinocrispum wychmicini]|uniref:3-methyladenine DNA glycosylase/8-oxoguanine DNA glycosylase n=1 Tax=Actinocrispum wychmicini TaxID=1213861 RepID=A0A4R2K1T9_9PSEU|nr:DNA-3-methyladenine glycosylase [Actinocrispum wychmicini]TCO65662.1 3-methyladenine DNA glycosylase/8-oxoguanine DNA glycosylase [Actinocrispum wychmicini]